jgi:nucleoside-diphosphate-sugar epimerase
LARYLVTGGAGFMGSHLVDALSERGEQVRVLDNLSTGRRANIEHALAQIEFIDMECIFDVVAPNKNK